MAQTRQRLQWLLLQQPGPGHSSGCSQLASEEEEEQMWAALLLVGTWAGWWEVQTQATC